jgi:hypothetical protein
MEAARTSETFVNFYQTTRCYNPEDSNLHLLLFAPVSPQQCGHTHTRQTKIRELLINLMTCYVKDGLHFLNKLAYTLQETRGKTHLALRGLIKSSGHSCGMLDVEVGG